MMVLLSGCEEEAIRSYTAPKDPPSPDSQQPAMSQAGDGQQTPPNSPQAEAGVPGQGSEPPDIKWELPGDWRQVESDQRMRLATFATGEGDERLEVALTRFRGNVGGLRANINRWRGQLGLEPLSEAQAPKPATAFEGEGLKGRVFIIPGQEAEEAGQQQMMVAMLRGAGWSWFFKARGTAEQLDAHREDFLAMTRSVRLAEASEEQAGGMSAPARGGESGARESARWEAPAGWREEENVSAPLDSAYRFGADDQVRVTVSRIPGEAGGVLANVNRWRGQQGRPPIEQLSEQRHEHIETPSGEWLVFEIADSSRPAEAERHMTVGMTSRGNARWFVKMTGPAEAVRKARPTFLDFVRSFRFEAQ